MHSMQLDQPSTKENMKLYLVISCELMLCVSTL